MKNNQSVLFPNGEDTPLFSQVPVKKTDNPYDLEKLPDPTQLDFYLCSKCKDTKTVKVNKKSLPCPYCQS